MVRGDVTVGTDHDDRGIMLDAVSRDGRIPTPTLKHSDGMFRTAEEGLCGSGEFIEVVDTMGEILVVKRK